MPSKEPEPPAAIGREVRIAVDEERRRVVFERWGELAGVGAELVIALAAPFREAVRDELAPQHFPFTAAASLKQKTNCNSDVTLRRRILRFRNWITVAAERAGQDPPPSTDAVIENNPWHGYRLNPDRVRILASSELRS